MEKTTASVPLDMLSAIEQIVEAAEDSKLSKDFYEKVADAIAYVSAKQQITPEQSVMLSVLVNNVCDNHFTLNDMADYLKCSTVHLLRCSESLDVMVKRGFVNRRSSDSDSYYSVSPGAIEAFKKDGRYERPSISNLSCERLFVELDNLYTMHQDDNISDEELHLRVIELLDNNPKLTFVKRIRKYHLNNSNLVMLVSFCHLLVNEDDYNVHIYQIEKFFGKNYERQRMKRELRDGSNVLIRAKLIEHSNNEGLLDSTSYRLTRAARSELLAEVLPVAAEAPSCAKEILRCDNIVQKHLFYNNAICQQVSELGRLLEESNYRRVVARMKEQGFRSGFACLFYGAPGTGKTETVLQIARTTGRNIMQVNVAQIKSAWVGESEKNIKALFERYGKLVAESPVAPILLFNEADAIIGRRLEKADRAVEKMENSLQNIILQEMENLDGILIATTNLAQNLDAAFERRFLYKINFAKPTVEARMAIWHTMLPALAQSEIRTLAERYDFSGGQIENIARHYAIDCILHGNERNPFDAICSHCDSECLTTAPVRKIGF